MGYYSEVAFTITAKALENLRNLINNNELELALVTLEMLENADKHSIDEETKAEIFYWSASKWYHDFEEISCFHNALDELDFEDYLFIRIGEEFEDIEMQGYFWENPFGLDLVRTVEFSIAEEENIIAEEAEEVK